MARELQLNRAHERQPTFFSDLGSKPWTRPTGSEINQNIRIDSEQN